MKCTRLKGSLKPGTRVRKEPSAFFNGFDYYGGYEDYDGRQALKFMTWSMDERVFVFLGVAEYMTTSLSLGLVLAKFFPAVHNQIVSRATRLEHQSIYWGTVVVSNIFTYGLLFAAMRGWSVALQLEFLFFYNAVVMGFTTVQEMIITVIMFVGAVIASLRSHSSTNVPIPRGMAKAIINLSFCWSCFCCCFCCSPQCKAKAMKALVLFGFMNFVYHSVMDVISIAFLMFIEDSRTTIITLTLCYFSLLVFLVLFNSFSIFSLFRGRNNNDPFCRRCCNLFGGLCLFITVFPAIMLMVVIYMIIVFSLNLKGVTGILTGLIPSIALSAASWYIRKRLLKNEASRSNIQDQPANDEVINNREREDVDDVQNLLFP